MASKRVKKKDSKTKIDPNELSFEQTIRAQEYAARKEAYARYNTNVGKIAGVTAKIANKQARADERDAMMVVAKIRYEEDLFACIKALYSGTPKRISGRFELQRTND